MPSRVGPITRHERQQSRELLSTSCVSVDGIALLSLLAWVPRFICDIDPTGTSRTFARLNTQVRNFLDIVSKCGTGCQGLIEGTAVSATTPAVHALAGEPDADQDLVACCRDGEWEAFAKLVLKYQSRVLTLAARIINNRSEAEDVAQDIFVKVFQSLHDFRGTSRFSTWIYRITVNHCLNHLRRRVRQQQSLGSTEVEEWTQASPMSNPHKTLEQKERWAIVQAKLQLLTPEHRTIVLLRDFEGLSYEEIADVLRLESGTVKSRLHRARMELKALLEPFMAGEG
jgi:RNA polymerase sigma-70 factor, ECF subfamily